MRCLAGLLLLAGCTGESEPARTDPTDTAHALDRAAIASGQLPDPTAEPTGAYRADTEIGVDRLCLAGEGGRYRVGLFVSYGTGGACEARGTARRTGETLRLTLAPDCRADARIGADGVTIAGRVPDGCAALCTGRASLAGVSVPKVSDSTAEALAMTGPNGAPLCAPPA